jgi:lysophospholipase L1-like esterase
MKRTDVGHQVGVGPCRLRHGGRRTAALILAGLAVSGFGSAEAQTYRYDFGPAGAPASAGFTAVNPSQLYSSSSGFGFEKDGVPTCQDKGGDALTGDFCTMNGEILFSVKVPQGNYDLKVYLGDPSGTSETTVKVENRRLLFDRVTTASGKSATRTITVNRREAKSLDGTVTMSLKDRELGYYTWDEKLTLRFSGRKPAVSGLELTKADHAITWFLCGNSTVVDQLDAPWSTWGMNIPRFFKPGVVIANYAESGLTAAGFLSMKRLTKLLADSKPGDYVSVEFGHNDQKNASEASAYPNTLKSYVDQIKAKGCIPIFTAPTAREGDTDPRTSIGGLAQKMRDQAKALGVAFIDLNQMTMQVMNAYGSADAHKCYMDGTHFTEIGGYELARCVAKGLKEFDNSMAPFLLDDRPTIDPGKPDPIDYLTLQLDPEATLLKTQPDRAGNPLRDFLPNGLFEDGNGSIHSLDGKKLDIRILPSR